MQSDLVKQQRAISVLENQEEGLLRGESRYGGLDIIGLTPQSVFQFHLDSPIFMEQPDFSVK